MIDWLLRKAFGIQSEEKQQYTYDEISIPIRSVRAFCGRQDESWYETKVRYNDEEIQIFKGRPRNVGWETVESEELKSVIRKQIDND